MTEKQQQLLFDKGITNVPSDVLCSDNALAESVGMVYDDGEHRVIQKPTLIEADAFILGTTTELVIIHRFNDVIRYIIQVKEAEQGSGYAAGDICCKIKSGNNYTITKTGVIITGEVNAETIGNTLILSSTAGMNYLLWDYVNNKYKNLGTQIPDIKMRFSLGDVNYLGIDPNTGEPYTNDSVNPDTGQPYTNAEKQEHADDLDQNTFVKLPKIAGDVFGERTIYDDSFLGIKVIRSVGNTWKADTGSDYEEAKTGLIGLVSARLNWVKERKHFAFPFWARSAVRLYDGSHVNISNPFLLMPTVLNNWHIFACDYQKPYTPRIQYINKGDEKDWLGWDQANYMPLCAKLYYKAIYPSNDFNIEDWADIISGVDIFVSDEVKSFDMEGKWTILNVDSPEMDINQPQVYTSDTCAPIYDILSTVKKYDNADEKTWNTYYKPALLSDEELIDRLVKQSVFYKIIELDRDEVAFSKTHDPIDTTDKIDRGVLTNLITQPTLENDDYFSHSKFVPGIIKTYNSRLHLADVWRSFYSGYNHFSFTAYTRLDSTAYVPDTYKWLYFYVHIKSESGERIVRASGRSYEIYNIWFFYPDPRAYQLDVYYSRTGMDLYKYPPITLKEHPSLHGAYYFGHLPGLNEVSPAGTWVATVQQDEPLPLPSTETNYELLEGQVIVSEVNNPWLFNAAGYVNVGMGRVNGLASQTVALGQEEHGIHPLIVFSQRGISTLRLNNEGVYVRSDELSREVCCNRKSITETDGAVFFVSEKGLMVVVGNQVKCVSEQLAGISDAWAEGKAETEFSNYSTFFKNCFIAYDYRDSLLWLFDGITRTANGTTVKGLQHCLVYAIKSGTFAKTMPLNAIITRVVNNYPDYILESGRYLYSLINRPSVSADRGTYSAMILTRPMKLENALALKSIERIANMGYFTTGSNIELEIYASNNLTDWAQLTSLRGMPWLFYRFLYNFTGLRATDRFAGSVLITQERRNNKLRFVPAKNSYDYTSDEPNNQDDNPQPSPTPTPDPDENPGRTPGRREPIPDPDPNPVPERYTYRTRTSLNFINIPAGSSSVTMSITVYNQRTQDGVEYYPCELYVKIWKRVGTTYTQLAAFPNPIDGGSTTITVTEDTDSIVICANKSVINTQDDYVARQEIPVGGFDKLLSEFQDLLPKRVTKGSKTYYYLLSAYTMADEEWNNPGQLFSARNFEEVKNYRGSNDQYEIDGTAYRAMQAWLMAMCLSEIAPSSGTSTNNQTEYYKKAYNLVGGRNVPLYGNYTIMGDLMVVRMVAASIYAKNRAGYTFNNIDEFRSEIGGSVIDLDGSWTDLGYAKGSKGNIGYYIALNDIFPSAPGPFISSQSRSHPSEQPADLFYTGQEEGHKNWWAENYKVDVGVDNEVTEHYKLEAADGYLARTVQAKADEFDATEHFFGERTYYKYSTGGSTSTQGQNVPNPRFTFVPGIESDRYGFFDGTFSSLVTGKDLSSISGDDASDFSYFMGRVKYIGGYARYLILDFQRGRRRPAQGLQDKSARCPSGDEYRLNWLDDSSIDRLVGGGTKYDANGGAHTYYIDSNGNGHWDTGEPYYNDGVTEGADNLYPSETVESTTYPSGHSAGVWSTAVFVTMFFPEKYREIFKAAYDFSVSRSIVRAHWNSDIIYGRLIGTMITPVINAIRNTTSSVGNYRLIYENAYNQATGGGSADDDQKFYTVYNACRTFPQGNDVAFDHRAIGTPGTITFRLTNNSSKRIPYNGRFCFFVVDGSTYKQCYGHYREPNSTSNSYEHWYYVNPSNYILEIGDTLTITVPIKRYVGGNNVQDLTGKTLYINSSKYFRLYFSNTEDDDYLHNGSHNVSQMGITNPAITNGAVFDIELLDSLMPTDPYYLQNGLDYNTPKLYISHTSSNGKKYMIPMRLSDWENG